MTGKPAPNTMLSGILAIISLKQVPDLSAALMSLIAPCRRVGDPFGDVDQGPQVDSDQVGKRGGHARAGRGREREGERERARVGGVGGGHRCIRVLCVWEGGGWGGGGRERGKEGGVMVGKGQGGVGAHVGGMCWWGEGEACGWPLFVTLSRGLRSTRDQLRKAEGGEGGRRGGGCTAFDTFVDG